MQDLNDLYYYVQAVDHGGFAPAGRMLSMPKSKLSRRIAMLEERLGVRLIQRSTRHFVVTEAGQTYYMHCKAMLVEAEAAQEAIDTLKSRTPGCNPDDMPPTAGTCLCGSDAGRFHGALSARHSADGGD